MHKTQYGNRSCSGFTLLELLFTSLILLITISGLFFAFISCAFLNESNNDLVVAANDAQYVLEQVKALNFSSIDTYVPPVFTNLSGENIPALTVTNISSRVKQVTVNVNWTDRRRRQRSFSLSTRIANQ